MSQKKKIEKSRILFHEIAELMTLKDAVKKDGRRVTKSDLSIIKNAAVIVNDGVIEWVGTAKKLPKPYKKCRKISLGMANVFPGFIDCHTHLVFAGDRKDEFELRNQGVSYQEIAERGGGILSTVRATRKASLADLQKMGQERVDKHLRQGVTTIEIKSGYGLNKKAEEKILQAIQGLKKANIVSTFLGAHAIPSEFKSESEYLDSLKKDLVVLKKKNLSQRVDIFIERGYFSIERAREYLLFAKELGFQICIHADQLNRTEAARLAVELKAVSADHVIQLSDADKKALASSPTTAVLLPTADFYLQCPYPDARQLIDLGGRVALATDFNPGSSPTQNMSLVGVLARLEMKMTLPEVFAALTYNAAAALGRRHLVGALLPNYQADFFVTAQPWQDFFYDMGSIPVESTFVKGRRVF